MKKILFLIVCCMTFASSAFAQISTGKITNTTMRTGNRAEVGNLGIYLGVSTDMFRKLTDSEDKGIQSLEMLPLINLKYMATDEVELRTGIEWFKQTYTRDSGTESTDSESSFMLSPGVAFHFNSHNLLDVYVGGEMPFGWGSMGSEYGNDEVEASNFKFGLGAFIGLQCYVANLPVAIGLEYGITGLYNTVSDGVLTSDGMTISRPREDFDESKFQLGNQLRLTLSYYFDL